MIKESKRNVVRSSHAKDDWHGVKTFTRIDLSGPMDKAMLERVAATDKTDLVYVNGKRFYASYAIAKLEAMDYWEDRKVRDAASYQMREPELV